jgi:hypothetical protein
VELEEVLFTSESRECADRLAAHLDAAGYRARVVAGDGSGTVWQVRATPATPREFADDREFDQFLDLALRPLDDRFEVELAGAGVIHDSGGSSTCAILRLRTGE